MKKLKVLVLLISLFIPAFFYGCENSNKKSLSTPTILEIKNGTILFNPVNDAEYYTIAINNNEINVDVKHSEYVEIIDNQIHYNATKIFEVGESYSVQIKAKANKKISSPYSQSYSYKHYKTINKPTLVSINSTVLTWEPVENATYYKVKILTPDDNIVFDEQGNVLDMNDTESIAKANITEYSFNNNQFEFSSLINSAGTYHFYVCAVIAEGSHYAESGYAQKVTYENFINLSTPINGKVYKIGNEIFLSSIIDSNSNAITVKCGDYAKTSELNNSNTSISITDNLLTINLNKYFSQEINANIINLEDYKKLHFATQSKHISTSTSYFINSSFSGDATYNNTYQLATPTLNLTKNSNTSHTISWTCVDSALVSEYSVIICDSEGVKTYKVPNNLSSLILDEAFVAVSIQAIGKGNYLNSSICDFIPANQGASNLSFTSSVNGYTVSWSNIANAYYVVSYNNEYYVTNNTSHLVNINDFASKNIKVSVTAIKEGYKPKTVEKTIPFNKKLKTPTFASNQGFVGTNIYELSFTGDDNALGYYVYLKGANSTEFNKIPKLFTSTKIDLSKYIISEGIYNNYQVKVQAVADLGSLYQNSDLSSAINISHIQVLESPEFYKLNNIIHPVIEEVSGSGTKYILQFYGVDDAGSYEVLVNYNKIDVQLQNDNNAIYRVDITNYLLSANKYELKIRALPHEDAHNTLASDYAVSYYTLTKQLPMVENIQVSENDGVYTLTFNPVNNADNYLVRVIKENDANYVKYLQSINLNHTFTTKQAIDVSQYVKQQGVYYFYITALAPTNSFYANSNESKTCGVVSKEKTSLSKPSELMFSNNSKDSYILSWVGDENADNYLVKLTDTFGVVYEISTKTADTFINISDYLKTQGEYKIAVYSTIDPTSENALTYQSSEATEETLTYLFTEEHDYLRHSVSIYGSTADYYINDVQELKNLLWHNYLYGIDNLGLKIMISLEGNGKTYNNVREAIVNYSKEATNLEIYNFIGSADINDILNPDVTINNFDGDTTWYNKIKANAQNIELLSYLSEKLLAIYPEFNILEKEENWIIDDTNLENVFTLTYNNKLNTTKVNNTETLSTFTDYGNNFKYIDSYARKSATGYFEIDSREEVYVTTTEQLIQAVQHNKKPKFVGNSILAEQVYSNAKLVLSAIVSNNMTDLQKATAIFDWLEYEFNLAYYNEEKSIWNPTLQGSSTMVSGTIEHKKLEEYGLFKQYYLEGIFEEISLDENGNILIGHYEDSEGNKYYAHNKDFTFVPGNKIATSWSFSKAFALLCSIEGIDVNVINGTYTYTNTITSNSDEIAHHTWNKVKIGEDWYALDITMSDSKINFTDYSKSYNMSSHIYFLTTDTILRNKLKLTENTSKVSESYFKNATTSYNYYANSTFALSYSQLSEAINNFGDASTVSGFKYTKQFYNDNDNSTKYYQGYKNSTTYGDLQNFILNSLIYTEYMVQKENKSGYGMFEMSFENVDNDIKGILNTIFSSTTSTYNIELKDNLTYFTITNNNITTLLYFVESSNA